MKNTPSRALLAALAAASAAAGVVTYVVAVGTELGLRVDRAVYARVSGLPAGTGRHAASAVVSTIYGGSVVLFVGALGFVAFIRRRRRRGVVAGLAVLAAIGTTELLKPLLARVDPLGRAAARGRGWDSWPSGHATAAMALALALVVTMPPILRPAASVVGAAYAAAVGVGLVALGAHLPSDVIGGFFVATFWACGGAMFLRPCRVGLARKGLALAAGGVAAAGALGLAAAAGRHVDVAARAREVPALAALVVAVGAVSLLLVALYAPLVEEPVA